MALEMSFSQFSMALAFASIAFGCEEKVENEAVSTAPSAPTVAAAPTPTPAPTPPPKPREDCPQGSSGLGTSSEPCKASGDSRMMEVKYIKTTDEGPKFQVINKASSPILYGSVVAYFYDKAGKQLQVTHGGKPKPSQSCSGNIFAGAVKPEEKIYVFFSCIKKDHVPEGTASIEAEVKTVGFTDEEGKKNEFYWSNPDLVPDERPRSTAKAKGKKK